MGKMEGNSQVKLMLTTALVWISTSSDTLISVKHCLNPTQTDSVTSSDSPSASRERRYCAKARSASLSHGVFEG